MSVSMYKHIIISLFILTAQLSSTTVPTEKVSSKTHKKISLSESALYSSFNTVLHSVDVYSPLLAFSQ